MTRADRRAQCIDAIGRALDPDWQEIAKLDASYGLAIQYKAARILDSLHGIAWVIQMEATNGSRPLRYGNIENNNLTNPPEEKP